MTTIRHLITALVLGLLACGETGRDNEAPPAPAAADSPAAGTRQNVDTALERHAGSIVAFLRGAGDFDPALLADSVTLRVAPEGGGATTRVPREALLDRGGWRVGDHDIAPPPGGELTLAEGRHFRCMEGSLDQVAPDLAGEPHVGALVRADSAGSCLQTWNATFVFGEPGPRLSAVVYDQWEW